MRDQQQPRPLPHSSFSLCPARRQLDESLDSPVSIPLPHADEARKTHTASLKLSNVSISQACDAQPIRPTLVGAERHYAKRTDTNFRWSIELPKQLHSKVFDQLAFRCRVLRLRCHHVSKHPRSCGSSCKVWKRQEQFTSRILQSVNISSSPHDLSRSRIRPLPPNCRNGYLAF